MPEISRLVGPSGWIDMEFVERERTPEPAMKLGIQSHLAGLSLSNTVSLSNAGVSSRLEKRFTTGFRKPIYSQQTGNAESRRA